MQIYGWTINQWARAFAVFERKLDTLADAVEIQRDWLNKWGSPPTEQAIIAGVYRDMDYDAVTHLLELLSHE